MPGGNPASWTSSAKASIGAGRLLGGLEHDRASGREGPGASFAAARTELRVPRHDRRDHADRLATGPDLHVGFVDGQMRAFDLVGHAAVIAVILRDVGNLGAGLTDDLAGVSRLDLGQAAHVALDEVREDVEHLAPRGRGQPGPGRIAQGPGGGGDGAVHVRRARLGHPCPGAAGRGIDALEPGAAILEAAVDVLLELFQWIVLFFGSGLVAGRQRAHLAGLDVAAIDAVATEAAFPREAGEGPAQAGISKRGGGLLVGGAIGAAHGGVRGGVAEKADVLPAGGGLIVDRVDEARLGARRALLDQ